MPCLPAATCVLIFASYRGMVFSIVAILFPVLSSMLRGDFALHHTIYYCKNSMIEPQVRNIIDNFKVTYWRYEHKHLVQACATLFISLPATLFELVVTLLAWILEVTMRTCSHLNELQLLLVGFRFNVRNACFQVSSIECIVATRASSVKKQRECNYSIHALNQ